jgi:hypothetical protein
MINFVSVRDSEDRWYATTLSINRADLTKGASNVLTSALNTLLVLQQQDGDFILGYFPAGGCALAVNLLERPSRRWDKSFLFSSLARRQEARRKFPDKRGVQYLVVQSDTLRDIGMHAGGAIFLQAMNDVAFGIFAYGSNSILYYPLKPDVLSSGFGPNPQGTHEYETSKYLTNLLAESTLNLIGKVEYV